MQDVGWLTTLQRESFEYLWRRELKNKKKEKGQPGSISTVLMAIQINLVQVKRKVTATHTITFQSYMHIFPTDDCTIWKAMKRMRKP